MKRRSRAPRDIEPLGTPEANLEAFVELARESGKYGNNLPFYGRQWDVTGQTRDRPGLLTGNRSMIFGPELSGPSAGSQKPMVAKIQGGPLLLHSHEETSSTSSVGSYVRSYLRLMQDPSHAQMKLACTAGHFLARAMTQHGVKSVDGITSTVLTTASKLVSAHYTKDAAGNVEGALKAHACFLETNGLTTASVARWRPRTRRASSKSRKGDGAATRSKNLLPSDRVLLLILLAYQSAEHPADVIITRIIALLLAAPERINEVLAIGVDPEVTVRSPSGQPALGLIWAGSKRYPNGVKVIPHLMCTTILESLDVLHALTEEGRRIKSWYDDHPDRLYLPPEFEHLRGTERLRASDVMALLGSGTINSAHRTVERLGIQQLAPIGDRQEAAYNVSFAAFEKCFLAMLPQQMRDAGGSKAKPLLVVRMRTFRRAQPFACMFEKVTYRRVASALMPSGSNVTIFRRLGLDPTGEVRVSTKAFRHYLSTLAKRGGLSDTDLALWSGRKDTRTNRTYDHRTSLEMMEGARRVNPTSRRTTSPLARARKTKNDKELGA